MIDTSVVQKTQEKPSQDVSEPMARPRFLVVGYGSDTEGDGTVGLQIANRVSAWKIPSLTSISTYRLTPDLVHNLAAVDYVFFVSLCHRSNHAQTLQIEPIFASGNSSSTHLYTPITLLKLTQQLYGRSPQAWLLQVPAGSTNRDQGLSSTAQKGLDRALRTIEQFLVIYQQPPTII